MTEARDRLDGESMVSRYTYDDAERRAELRWLPPIAVRLEDAAGLPTTIRPVS